MLPLLMVVVATTVIGVAAMPPAHQYQTADQYHDAATQTGDRHEEGFEEPEDDFDYESQSETVLRLQLLAEASLREHTASLQELDRIVTDLKTMLDRSADHQTKQTELLSRHYGLSELTRHVNGIQADILASRLKMSQTRELRSRVPSSDASVETTDPEEETGVTYDELDAAFNAQEILKESNQQLEEWAVEQMLAQVSAATVRMNDRQGAAKPKCISAAEAAQMVQETLVSHSTDTIGIIDHAPGSKVIYELTSETYSPPPSDGETLGTVWWRHHIPEDWESILPTGWENWSMAIPSTVYNLLVRPSLYCIIRLC